MNDIANLTRNSSQDDSVDHFSQYLSYGLRISIGTQLLRIIRKRDKRIEGTHRIGIQSTWTEVCASTFKCFSKTVLVTIPQQFNKILFDSSEKVPHTHYSHVSLLPDKQFILNLTEIMHQVRPILHKAFRIKLMLTVISTIH